MALAPSAVILSTDEMGRVAPPIFASVGEGGVNKPGDVFVIQSLLNDRLPQPHSIPAGDRRGPDIGFVLAIEAYQAVVLNMNPPSGRVDPGSETYYSLAAHPLVADAGKPPPRFGHVGKVPARYRDRRHRRRRCTGRFRRRSRSRNGRSRARGWRRCRPTATTRLG